MQIFISCGVYCPFAIVSFSRAGSMLLHCVERNEFVSHPERHLIHYQALNKLQSAFTLSQSNDNDVCLQASFKMGEQSLRFRLPCSQARAINSQSHFERQGQMSGGREVDVVPSDDVFLLLFSEVLALQLDAYFAFSFRVSTLYFLLLCLLISSRASVMFTNSSAALELLNAQLQLHQLSLKPRHPSQLSPSSVLGQTSQQNQLSPRRTSMDGQPQSKTLSQTPQTLTSPSSQLSPQICPVSQLLRSQPAMPPMALQPIPVSSKLKKILLTQFMDYVDTRSVRVLFALFVATTEFRQLKKCDVQ